MSNNSVNNISVDLFEKNAKINNKKALRRSVLSIAKHPTEYLRELPLGYRNDCVIELNVDKCAILDILKLLKDKGYRIIGTSNLVPLEVTISNLESNDTPTEDDKKLLERAKVDYNNLLKTNQEYLVDENDDCKCIISPYKDGVSNIISFIEDTKNELLELAKRHDVTVILYVTNILNNLKGAIGYCFLDGEENNTEVVDFYTSFSISVNFADSFSTYKAGFATNSLLSDILDAEFLNLSYEAYNLKYTK